MDLFILRHGKAGDHREWDGDDTLRPLSEDGVARTRAVLRRLAAALTPEAIWTSPWLRASQTAAIAGEVWELEPEEHAILAGDIPSPAEVVEALRVETIPEVLMLVGHEPNLGELVGHLLGAPPLPLKKAGLAWLRGRPAAGAMELVALLPPGLVLDLGD